MNRLQNTRYLSAELIFDDGYDGNDGQIELSPRARGKTSADKRTTKITLRLSVTPAR